MHCHVCNVAVGDGQRFCHECGQSLTGVTDPTERYEVIPADASTDDDGAQAADGADDSVATDDVEDREDAAAIWSEAGSTEAIDTALMTGSTVVPPTHPEPESAPPSRRPLPNLADVPDDDSFGQQHPATASMDATPEPTSPARDAAASDPVGRAPVDEPPPAHEATTTMPITGRVPQQAGASVPTSQMSATRPNGLFDGARDAEEYALPSNGFRLRASFVFAFLAMIATLLASAADVIDIRTTRPIDGIIPGIRTVDDFGSNLTFAGFVGAALMVIGGLLACFGLRWGAGLAGGAGLSTTGWAFVTLGLVETPIHAAQGIAANPGEVATFTLSITRDLGYFLVVAIGVLGFVVFVVSLRLAGTGGRNGLNPWIAALGALAAVVVTAGPLIPLGGADLDANLGVVGIPREFFAARLIQLGLIAVTGVVGFLSVRTYGLGMAAGGLGVAIWMWITALVEFGDRPVSIAVGNLGTSETTPHAVTTVGVTASIALLLVAATVATSTNDRN